LTPPCYQLQKPPETAALFLQCAFRASSFQDPHLLETINAVAAGLRAVGEQ
jgi:hypothetical protein